MVMPIIPLPRPQPKTQADGTHLAESAEGRTANRQSGVANWEARILPFLLPSRHSRSVVLSLAQRLAGASKREIAELVSWASEGAFHHSEFVRLTTADLAKLLQVRPD